MAWVEAESKKHPGRKYYYNRETKESTWECPVDFKESNNGSSQPTLASLDGSSKPEGLKLQQSANEASMDTDSVPVSVPENKEAGPTSLERTDSISSSYAGPPTSYCAAALEAEDMDCSDKWGEDVEVAMDVDVSNQLDRVIEMVHAARSSLATNRPSELEGFGISDTAGLHLFTERLYLILDTNVLLSHLEFLNELKDSAIKDIGRPTLVIPWVVMQELDALKGNNKIVGSKAHKAINFLHGCFSSHHPRVRGQSMLEVSTEFSNRAIGNNDDSILHCCLLYQENVKGCNGIVVLFTNDKQLYNKAVISGVRAMDRKALLPELRAKVKASCTVDASKEEGGASVPDLMAAGHRGVTPVVEQSAMVQKARQLHFQPLVIQGSSAADSPTTPSPITPSPITPSPITPSIVPSPSYFEDRPAQQKSTLSEAQVRQLLNVAEIALQEALTAGIEREMKEAYDNLWMQIVALKPPWSLRDATFLIERHWVPVFGIALHRGVKDQSTVINKHASRRPGHITSRYVHELLQSAVFIIRAFKEKSDCGGVLTSSLDTITKTMEQLEPSSPPKNRPMRTLSLPLATLTPLEEKKVALQRISSAPPTGASDQFKWSLELVLVTLEYYILQVPETLRTCSSTESQLQLKTSVRQLCEVAEAVVVCLSNLELSNVANMQDTVLSLGRFTEHVLSMPCPVTIEGLYSFITQSEDNKAIVFNMLCELRKGLSQLVVLMT